MTQSSNKFEQLLELLINEETDKAEQLFHDIVVEKSRDIYEGLADSENEVPATTETKTETKDEAKEDDKKEEVKETEKSDEKAEEKKDEAVKETEGETVQDKDIKDEGVFTKQAPVVAPQKSDEESIEEIGGDATDQLVKDIASDEEGEGDAAADELGQDIDADNGENGEEGSVEDRVVDLEDALDELKAEFEAMLATQNGEEAPEEAALAPKPIMAPQETQPDVSRFEAKAKEDKKETVKEYKLQKSADNKDNSDKSAKSPVSSGSKIKTAAAPIKTGSGSEEKGRSAPTAKAESGFENSPAKDKSASYKKEVKANNTDSSDKSAKSPVNARA